MADGYESHRSMMVKVGIFTVTMLLVAVGLVVIFGEFRFGPSNTYHANFIDATRLKGGPEGPYRRGAGGFGQGTSSSTRTTRSTSLSLWTSATRCTRRRAR